MGQYESGKTIIFLSIYFIALIFILSIVQVALTSMGIPYSFVTSDDESQLLGFVQQDSLCTHPRTFTTSDGSQETISQYQKNSASCQWTDGSYDALACDSIVGCTWQNATTSFFFFEREASCEGSITLTNYSQFTNQTTAYFKTPQSTHENDTIYIVRGHIPQYVSPQTQNVIQDICLLADSQTSCDMLGCTWVNTNQLQPSELGIGVIWDIVSGLFTFNVTFTSEYWTNLLLTLILFYIPLLMLIMALYFTLPFIH
jgi:hypothetical protein